MHEPVEPVSFAVEPDGMQAGEFASGEYRSVSLAMEPISSFGGAAGSRRFGLTSILNQH
jgi:hypothetical protein